MAVEFPILIDNLKAWLGLGSSASEQGFDAVLMRALEVAEKLVARYCGRGDGTWLTATRTEYFSGTFNGEVVLTYTPVTALTSVSKVSAATTAGVETTDSDAVNLFTVDGYAPGAAFTAYDGILRYRDSRQASFTTGDDLVVMPRYYATPNFGDGAMDNKVVYTGGYANVASVPMDLQQAILECAAGLAAESPVYQGDRERVRANAGRWKELAQPFVRGGGVL